MDHIVRYAETLGLLETLGVVGFIMYISAFAAVQWGLMNGNSTAYSLANVMSSSLVALSLIAEFNLSAALIQGSVIIIGVTGLCLRLRRKWSKTSNVLVANSDPETC
ncbi:CBU_0592 family membrane protein [Candidatus Rhodobacter oscarellae]|uniref:CBU_0592 family membrane protein n=1 Tax=Candidatus Rhodobacter oscarellae TaxID=1675527 RepID=UPI000AA95C6B|nr:hypothetical protein [Candidatus Rhodobacter lobularis]